MQITQTPPKIIIFPLLTVNSSCLPHGSNFGFNMIHQQFHFDTYMNPFLLAPTYFSFGEYYAIANNRSASWWHACNRYRCYSYDTPAGSSWVQPEAVCSSKGGHLLSLNTENELESLRDWAGTGISQNGFRYSTHNVYYRAEIFKKRLIFLGLKMEQKVTFLSDSYFSNSTRYVKPEP